MVKFDTRNLKNLNSKDFLGKQEKYFIIPHSSGDCVTEEKKVSSNGNEYSSYTLHVQQDNGLREMQIPFLFEKDLRNLIAVYGEDSTAWGGMLVLISSKQNGTYCDWELNPVTKKEA